MAKKSLNPENRSQRSKRMLAEMSNGRTFFWVGVALVIHAVIIIGTSYGYIRETVFHGKHEEAKVEDQTAPASTAASAQPAAPAKAPTADAHPATPAAGPTAGISDDDKKLAERKNSPEVQALTSTPKAGELPKTPQHNAFDIDDAPK